MNEDCCSCLLDLDLPVSRIHQISEFLIVNLQIGNPHRSRQSILAVLYLLAHEDILEAHLKNALLLIPFDGVRLAGACLSIGEDCRVIPLIDMVEDLFADIIEDKGVIYWRMAHAVICAVEAAMEAELFDLTGIGIAQSDLLALHLNDVLCALVDLLLVEGTHTHCNLDALSHRYYNFI